MNKIDYEQIPETQQGLKDYIKMIKKPLKRFSDLLVVAEKRLETLNQTAKA